MNRDLVASADDPHDGSKAADIEDEKFEATRGLKPFKPREG